MTDVDNSHKKTTPPTSDVNGLGNRIGLPKDRFIEFIVKETFDNALDLMEKEAPRLIKKIWFIYTRTKSHERKQLLED